MVVMRSSCSLPLHWAACWLAPRRSAPINNDADRRSTALLGTAAIDWYAETIIIKSRNYTHRLCVRIGGRKRSILHNTYVQQWKKQSLTQTVNQSINQSKQIYIAVIVFLRVWDPMQTAHTADSRISVDSVINSYYGRIVQAILMAEKFTIPPVSYTALKPF